LPRPSILDGASARIVALLVFLGCAGALAWLHRDDLFPPEPNATATDDPFARCLAERRADVVRMQEEGLIDAERAALFTNRAEAMCAAETAGGGPPSLPARE
jgi:hypothetical protein